MPRVDISPAAPTAIMLSPETAELAWELQQERPDTHRIEWLIEDRDADLRSAMKQANLKEADLQKKPLLRPLQKRLRK